MTISTWVETTLQRHVHHFPNKNKNVSQKLVPTNDPITVCVNASGREYLRTGICSQTTFGMFRPRFKQRTGI